MKQWTLNTETGGGAWGVISGRSREAIASRGEIRYMKCEYSGSANLKADSSKSVKGCECPWLLEWEQTKDGWLLRAGVLLPSQAPSQADGGGGLGKR